MDRDTGQDTFTDRSVIDYAIATAECFEDIVHFEVVETDSLFSDGHNALSWHISSKLRIDPSTEFTRSESQLLNQRPLWSQPMEQIFASCINQEQVENILSQLNSYPHSQETIDYISNEFHLLFQDAADKSSQNRTSRNQLKSERHYPMNKPWFGTQCHKARAAYHSAKKIYSKNNSESNRLNLRKTSKEYKRTMNDFISKTKLKNEQKLRIMSEKSPKNYWEFLNNIKPKHEKIETPSMEEFFEHFKRVNSNTINDDRFYDERMEAQECDEFLNSPITESEIRKCIRNLRNSKAASSSDNIINEYIKATADILISVYSKLFNGIFDTGLIRNTWLEGTIVPLYKNKGDPKDPINYRPITILSCLGKLFTSILNERSSGFLTQNNILNENQVGFRKEYLCIDHIFSLHSLFEILRKRKKKLFAAFVDLSQVFDRVWRTGLWHKLLKESINGKFLTVIYNMYQNIEHDGSFSQMFACEIGVAQGENLSPLLFSLFLNDLELDMISNGASGVELNFPDDTTWLKLLLLLYADDTVILSNDPIDFQNSLDIFNQYCIDWHLTVNANKTKVVIFGSRQTSNYIKSN